MPSSPNNPPSDAGPKHVAVIMDGNGRWARERGKPRINGHREGADRVQDCVDAAQERGVKYLTMYAFSSENWKRSPLEVQALMRLLSAFLKKKTPEMSEKNVRLRAIGELDRLPAGCLRQLRDSIAKTAENDGITLSLALSYGGRAEITAAARKLAALAVAGTLKPESIAEEDVANSLYAPDIPDPDLLIRTSGEMRLSNFLLWQLSYAEIYVSPKCWPDFKREDLFLALDEYQKRNRRYGA